MGSVNKVFLVGNLGRDAELRHTPNGRAVCNFSLATTYRWTDKGSGQRQERTEWHRVDLWGPRGEALQRYLTKGTQIYVEGRLQTDEWNDQSGNKRYTTKIVAQDIELLGGGSRGGDGGGGRDMTSGGGDYGGGGRQDMPGGGGESGPADLNEDDIPF